MEQNLSWKKAYIASALLHIVIAVLFAIGLAEIVAEHEQQTYVVDLTTSDFNQGSGHEGGGGAAAFPEPLKQEEVAKRVETVQQEQTIARTIEAKQTPTPTVPDAPVLPASTSSTPAERTAKPASPVSPGASNAGTSTGQDADGGTGTGSSTGSGSGSDDGQGSGEGTGTGEGSGEGDVPGTGNIPFDGAAFRSAVDANKVYPRMAIMRHLEGTTSLTCTIDAAGNIVDVTAAGSSGFDVLDNAAISAARAVGSFPNPTGNTVVVSIAISFYLSD